jgi:small subunit ribosomal protein S6
MASEYQRVREYELMVILHPELSEEDLGSAVTTIEGMITGQSGELRLTNREMPWGRRRLAYPIRHGGRDVRDGFYVLIYFTAVSTALAEIERDIKLDDRIMRYLLTQQSAPIMEPVVEEEGEEADGEAESGEETEAPRRTPSRRTTPADSDAPAPAATEPAVA